MVRMLRSSGTCTSIQCFGEPVPLADTYTGIDVQRVAKDAIVARVLFSGSAILRGLPAWVPVYKCVYALIRRACAGLGGQPASGLRGGQVEPWSEPVLPQYRQENGCKVLFIEHPLGFGLAHLLSWSQRAQS